MSRYRKALAFLVSTVPMSTFAAQFSPLPITPGTTEMRAIDVSSDGQFIVGQMHVGSSTRGFLWHVSDLMPTLLNDLPGGLVENESIAISDDGVFIVGRGETTNGSEAAIWPGTGLPSGLGDLSDGFNSSRATAVSNNGTVAVGTGHSMMGREAFRWTSGGGMQGLGFLPNGVASEAHGVSSNGAAIVGVSETFNAILGEAFRWTAASGMLGLGDLPGGDVMSQANAVSSSGNTVVGVASSAHGTEAFRWTSGDGMIGLGDLPGGIFSSTAYDVTTSGDLIVGAGTTEDANTTAFMWTPALGIRSVAEVLIDDYGLNSDLEGWDLLAASGISSDGRVIVGTGINPSGQVRAWWAELDGVQPRSGDLNGDGQLDVSDLESIQTAIRTGNQEPQFDMNRDATVNAADRSFWVHELKQTYFGDSNLDGQFESGDLVAVFVAAQYEDGVPRNSTWSTGDWNGDLEFTTGDLIFAFQDGGYERGAATLAVPEPATGLLSLVTMICVLRCRTVRSSGSR